MYDINILREELNNIITNSPLAKLIFNNEYKLNNGLKKY